MEHELLLLQSNKLSDRVGGLDAFVRLRFIDESRVVDLSVERHFEYFVSLKSYLVYHSLNG